MSPDFAQSRPSAGERALVLTDLANLLDEIRSPQRDEIRTAVAAASGAEVGPQTVSRITDAVMRLYEATYA